MKNEQERPFTPEQEAALEGERTKSDAELIKDGAKWKLNEKGEKENLEITEKQAHEMRMEREGGIADNLGTYIRMNKSILLSADEMKDTLKGEIKNRKGQIWSRLGGLEYEYVDKDGNLATFKVDAEKVKSLSEENRTERGVVTRGVESAIKKELTSLGFIVIEQPMTASMFGQVLEDAVRAKLQNAQHEQRKAKTDEFSF